jgi:prepilin-type N-terminal cleavage/methylation domain-containing protein
MTLKLPPRSADRTGTVPRLTPSRRADAGFTLVEVMVASFVLLIGLLSAYSLLDAANGATVRTRDSDRATNLTRELIEGARSVPYEKVSSPGVIAELQNLPGLEDVDAGAYTIRRGGITFAIGVDVCVMDDPKDGGGPRPTTATFCANSAPVGTADKNPEDYKRVTVSVTWTEGGNTRTSRQTGIINNPGSASGPAIRSLAPVGYAAPFQVTNNVASVKFDVTTSSKPATLSWLLDGTRQTGAMSQNGTSGLAWQFDWAISSLDDGQYVIAAEAADVYGVSGPGRQETVTLNRFVPRAPIQVTGGRTAFGTVEIEWTANSERDVVGYQVFRVGAASPVCEITAQKLDTFCTDHSPPGDAQLEYYVRAYDKDPTGALRASADSAHLLVRKDNAAPYPVTGLTLTGLANGDVKLTWQRPAPEDPDVGDAISFYRIYRGGTALGNRFDRYFDSSGNPTVSWTDTDTDGQPHSYWVTAVDQQYRESVVVGPVTG